MDALAVPTTALIPTPRPARLRPAIARQVFERAVSRVPVCIRYPTGRTIGDPSLPVLEVRQPAALFSRLGHDPKVGVGEAYMAGEWRAGAGTDLADLLTPFAAKLTTLVPRPLLGMRRLVDRPHPADQANTLSGARANIAAHYDLSNELFAAFLDPSMTYSCAWFADDDQRLEDAQLRKIDAMLDLAEVAAHRRVLEIGTGWGTLAIRAAQRGAHVTTVTLSQEQAALARDRVAALGLQSQVDVRVQDYREITGRYDAIVSVEMLEAVGDSYWPAYFTALDRLLAPGGRVALQTITMSHHRYLATRYSFGWIQKYIFPGGMIPSLVAIDQTLRGHTALRVSASRELGPHYARTLRHWRQQFQAQWPHVRTLGFDETFRRMWEFYLAYCEAGFRSGYLGVSQLQLRRGT